MIKQTMLGATTLIMIASSLGAQSGVQSQFLLGAQTVSGQSGAAALLAPDIAFRAGQVTGALNASGSMAAGATWVHDAHASLLVPVFAGAWHGLALSLSEDLMRPTPAQASWGESRAGLKLNAASANSGFDVAVGTVWYNNPVRSGVTPSLGSSVWVRSMGMTVTGRVGFDLIGSEGNPLSNRADSLSGGASRRLALSTDIGMSLRADVAGIDANASIGAFLVYGASTRPYGTVMLTRWVTPTLAITAGASRKVLDPVSGSTTTNALFGLRLGMRDHGDSHRRDAETETATAATIAATRSGDSVTIAFRAPTTAAHVELRGDFTDWKGATLTRRDDGLWAMTLALPNGVYRFDVRVDGKAWIVPPGVAHVVDAYEGDVGVVVVR